MGYNNNYAGMHMIWHSHYGKYENLEYYDRMAAEKEKEKRLITEKERLKVEEEKKVKNKNQTGKNNKKQSQINSSTHKNPLKPAPFGTESIISYEYYDRLSNIFRANVMIEALERKLDIYGIINECEEIMKKDILTNPPENSLFYVYPRLERDLVFINLLADKMKCSVSDLFIENKKKNKTIIYKLIDEEINKYIIPEEFDFFGYSENGVSFEFKDFDGFYEMADVRDRITSRMSLTLTKFCTNDKKVLYSISFGNLGLPYDSLHSYLFKGAYLWEEENGKLKDLIEKVIINHKDELMNETGFDYTELPIQKTQDKKENIKTKTK